MRKGTLWISLGAVLLAAALFLTLHNLWEANRAGIVSQNVLKKMSSAQPKPSPPSGLPPAADPTEEIRISMEIEIPDYSLNPNMEMPTETVDGNGYIGILELPSLELRLPVMSQWSYAGLKIAPCRYAGSAYRNDLVIAAHNYYSHFGYLRDLSQGDPVVFTDVDGNAFRYEVFEIETLSSTSVAEMTGGDWDLTLFTCTIGGQKRIAVRCARTEG